MREAEGAGQFRDAEAASRVRARLEELAGRGLRRIFSQGFSLTPDPDLALSNLERWSRAVSSPAPYLGQLEEHPGLSRQLMVVLGSSQPMADMLVQNPELASLLFDASELHRFPTRERIVEEARAMLAAVSSYSHALDRLRFLRQRWTLPIALNDLSGDWPQEVVWRALSELADGLISATVERVWVESRASQELGDRCPLLVVAFGKLGGHELNYSSDVDLAYVAPDGLPEGAERGLQRFCEALGRALSDAMGRGFLYRVDLRLRPYGAAGPLTPSQRAVESYYRLYAEPWELLALQRSRPIAGPPEARGWWERVVEERAYPLTVSDASLEAVVSMRARIEERSAVDDVKRGAGGIRDVEFLVQTLLFVRGAKRPEIRRRNTVEALRALDAAGLLEHSVAQSLIEGYTFLRQLEHRVQFVADQQTHLLPSSEQGRERLARLMGAASWEELARQVVFHRRTIESLYQSVVQQPERRLDSPRARVLQRLGPLGSAAAQWFDPLPESEAFYQGLDANQGSASRARTILETAPALVAAFRRSVPLTEMLLSGEIEEEVDLASRLESMPADTPLPLVAAAFADAHARLFAQWALAEGSDPHREASRITDALVRHCARRLYAVFDIVALGSYGREEVGFATDADLLLLIADRSAHEEAERQGQGLLAMLQALRRHGAPIDGDLRLRPEGGQGLLVRTYDGFRAYELERMEMWERLALGSARLVAGSGEARELAIKASHAMPLTPERLKGLVGMKRRIENERVPAQHARRHVKLGYGGLADLEWFVRLHEMRFPTATKAGEDVRLHAGIRALGRARLINAIEVEELLHALDHLQGVRLRLGLMGFANDTVPENPDKLDRLAHACGDRDGNAFLRRHERVLDTVRAIYQEGLERLRA